MPTASNTSFTPTSGVVLRWGRISMDMFTRLGIVSVSASATSILSSTPCRSSMLTSLMLMRRAAAEVMKALKMQLNSMSITTAFISTSPTRLVPSGRSRRRPTITMASAPAA